MLTNNGSTAKTIKLKDGRQLGYAEFGEPLGRPIFHFHGYPGSRLEGRIVHEAAVKCDARVITVDRPGMGLSDFKPRRTILDWPDDVVELADFLKIDQFAVEGASGGGPFSLACAYKISDRLNRVGILSGVGPYWDSGWPWARPSSLEGAESFWLELSLHLSEADRRAIRDSRTLKFLTEELFEAFRQGVQGPTYERELYGKDWGFRLEDVSPDVNVCLWHGELDVNVPVSMGRAVAKAIPNCIAMFYPEEGHYSTILNHLEEIIKTLSS